VSAFTINYHVYEGDHVGLYAQSDECMVLQISADEITSEVSIFAKPAVMVELLSETLTQAQALLDEMSDRPPVSQESRRRTKLGRAFEGAG
jgi:hypothetical protein